MEPGRSSWPVSPRRRTARAPGRPTLPPDPARHRHDPRGRRPRRGARLPASRATASRPSRAGRPCRTSGSARAATPSVDGWPCCGASATPTTTTPHTGRCPSSSRPSERSSSPWPEGWASWRRSRCKAGDEAPLEDVVDALAGAAYTRTDLVERRGEFAVRGGILDVFPPTEEHPVRVEFWGDTVEEIRWFKVADQRSLEIAQHGLWAPPCRELLLTDAVRERAPAAGHASCPAWPTCWPSSPRASPSRAWSRSCPSSWPTPAVCSRSSTSCPSRSLVCWSTPSASGPGPHDLVATSTEFLEASWVGASAGSAVPVDLQSVLGTASFFTLAELREHARVARPAVVDADLVRQRRRAGRVRRPSDDADLVERVDLGDHRRRALPRRHRGRGRPAARLGRRRVARRRRHRRPRPRPPRPRGARRARRRGHPRPFRGGHRRPASST